MGQDRTWTTSDKVGIIIGGNTASVFPYHVVKGVFFFFFA